MVKRICCCSTTGPPGKNKFDEEILIPATDVAGIFLQKYCGNTMWVVPGSNQRPSRCRRDALNQLS